MISQGMDAELAVGMHLLAGGLVWLVPLSNQDHLRTELFNCLRNHLPEAFLPDAPTSLLSPREVGCLRPQHMLCVVPLYFASTVCLQTCSVDC